MGIDCVQVRPLRQRAHERVVRLQSTTKYSALISNLDAHPVGQASHHVAAGGCSNFAQHFFV